ncbi:nitroreductase [Neolewinella xylanilytica]|uniref:Nitroreductase n=1 Tax=Neolewinella xylanilytica TaxID=1514080 RepID=A0A2S6I9G3_9BACT|nr:NAD(P)H-dependent oxidoreductase [Neolewinella xylanilytica]PPK88135.1 nitroreductase [Neolewinella xylanilytica]
MQLIESLRWRYATKRFDENRRVSDADLKSLEEAVNLAATSFGLQPFRVVVVSDPELKEQLRTASYNQPQLTECSHVFVFAAMKKMPAEQIDRYMDRTAEVRGVPRDQLDDYANYMKGSVAGKSVESIEAWNKRQAYIGLGTLLAAAAELRIDTCPMEGFDAGEYDRLLGLTEKGLTATVIAPVGYRSEEDATQHKEKVRVPLEEMFTAR